DLPGPVHMFDPLWQSNAMTAKLLPNSHLSYTVHVGGCVMAGKSKTSITPSEDRVVILPSDESETMRGGLYIPDTAKEKPTQGKIIAVGPGRVNDDGKHIPVGFKVGDVVIYGKYSGTPFTIDGEEVMIIKASDILAKLG